MFDRQKVWQAIVVLARGVGNALRVLGRPIVTQFPIFIVCVLVYGFKTIRSIRALLINPDPTLDLQRLVQTLAIYCLIGYAYAAINEFVSKRWLKVLSYVIIASLFLITSFLDYNFELRLSPGVFMLLGETTTREAGEFLSSTLMAAGSLTAYWHTLALSLAIIALECLRSLIARVLALRGPAALASALAVVVLVGGTSSAATFFGRVFSCTSTDQVSRCVSGFGSFPTDPYSAAVYSIYDLHLAANEVQMALETAAQCRDIASVSPEADSVTVVLVIGESYIKHHASLYGYDQETTPFLDAERRKGRLYAFDNVVSPFNLTSLALRNVLFCNSLGDDECWHESAFLPMVFKQAGYDVLFWDNQLEMAQDAAFSFALNSFLYDPQVRRMSYSQANTKSYEYDEGIVRDFARHAQLGARNLVMFHLMGQHVEFKDRYPHGTVFDYFTADSVHRKEPYLDASKRQQIAHYDNATRYNDYVMRQIISLFADKNAVVIYFSDHGEEVYDYRDSEGRRRGEFDQNLLKYQFEVPFVIWCSELFNARHAELCLQIAAAVHRPMMTDNVCHLLLTLAGIETPIYKSARDVLSADYSCPRRIIEDKVDYDNVMRAEGGE